MRPMFWNRRPPIADAERNRIAFEMIALDLTRLIRQADAIGDRGALLSYLLAQCEAEARLQAQGDPRVLGRAQREGAGS